MITKNTMWNSKMTNGNIELLNINNDLSCFIIKVSEPSNSIFEINAMSAIYSYFEKIGVINLIVDWSNIQIFCSHIIDYLIRIHKNVATRNGLVVFCNVDKNIQEHMKIDGTSQIFKIFDSLEECYSKFYN